MPIITFGDIEIGDTVQIGKKSICVSDISKKEDFKRGRMMIKISGTDDFGKFKVESGKPSTKECRLLAKGGSDGESVYTEEDAVGESHAEYWAKQDQKIKDRGIVGEDGLTTGERAAKHIQEIGEDIDLRGKFEGRCNISKG